MKSKKPRRPIVTADDLRAPAAPAPAPPPPAPAKAPEKVGYAGRITSASLSHEAAALARRLAIALALRDGKIPPLGEVLEKGLELLRAELEAEGIQLPPPAEVRPGPRR